MANTHVVHGNTEAHVFDKEGSQRENVERLLELHKEGEIDTPNARYAILVVLGIRED